MQKMIAEYAPAVYKALNGIFCIYKPSGSSIVGVVHALRTNLARGFTSKVFCHSNVIVDDVKVLPPLCNIFVPVHYANGELNAMPGRPLREKVVIGETLDSDNLPIITTVPDIADHPLVVGPRYITDDFELNSAGELGRHSSGVLVMGIGTGVMKLESIARASYLRAYHVKGQFGMATHDFSSAGRIIERTTTHHITNARLDRVLAAVQAGHQKQMFTAAGVDIQSQEAYELAVGGLIRPKDYEAGPIIYGIRCIEFQPPHFTLEIHAVNETCSYLMKLIHEIGLELRSTAACSQVRRIRYGHFRLGHALLTKHCNSKSIIENIALCQDFVSQEELHERTALLVTDSNQSKAQPLIESGQYTQDFSD